jgi:hypothetical protein
MQLGQAASVFGGSAQIGAYVGSNVYYGSGWKYITTGLATKYEQNESNSGAHKWWIAGSGTAGNAITFTQAMTLDSSGNLGIGTTSPARKLHVSNTADGFISRFTGGAATTVNIGVYGNSTTGFGSIGTESNHQLRFFTNAVDAVTIDTSGNLLVGTTSNAPSPYNNAKQYIASSLSGLAVSVTNTGYSLVNFFYNNATLVGYITTNGTGTTYSTASDYRLKEDIAPMTGALDTVAQLKPVTYKWKSDGSSGQGFIAHELQSVVPEAVVGDKDAVNTDGEPMYQGIDTSFLVATLTSAIQEQQALITALTARITALEAK